jgi:hypothetical protein
MEPWNLVIGVIEKTPIELLSIISDAHPYWKYPEKYGVATTR